MEHCTRFKGWGREFKKIVLAMAFAAAVSSFYQSWNNPFNSSLWVSSYGVFKVEGSNPAPDAASPPANLQNGWEEKVGKEFQLSVNSTADSSSDSNPADFHVDRNTVNGSDSSGDVVNNDAVNHEISRDEVGNGGKIEKDVGKSADLGPADKSESLKTRNSSPKRSRKGSSRTGASMAFEQRKEELMQAKEEIKSYGGVVEDSDLYWPIYHNISTFKKSYELMEKIFKVYVYREGPRPYFHQPEMKGIYASEGWFMKLMDENRHFVVNDPRKAHMFYLPYSLYRLVEGLYDPNSHNMHPISLFLRDYVNMIASKYPFWNRTQGADHFFVACHDWGTYTTTKHAQLQKNAVKVVCNADLSEGVFVLGKDVSLPETYVRNLKHPTRNLGGKSVSERTILAFFAGNMHGRVRPILLQHWKDKDDDMKIYEILPYRVARKMSYAEHMKSSKYCICPMGFEVNSPRIVEAIFYGCVPVIIADNFVPPLNEVLNWEAFSVTVAEKDIPKLKDILLSIPEKKYLSMQLRVRKVQIHFLWHRRPVKYDIFHMILHSIWFNRLAHIEP